MLWQFHGPMTAPACLSMFQPRHLEADLAGNHFSWVRQDGSAFKYPFSKCKPSSGWDEYDGVLPSPHFEVVWSQPWGFLVMISGSMCCHRYWTKKSIGYLAIWTKHFRWLPYCCPIYLSYPVIRIDSINLGSGPSISGEYTSAFLSQVFSELDKQNRFNLSQARFLKDRANWANSESWAAHSGLVME